MEKSSCSERRRPRRHHRFAPVSALPPSLPLMSLRAACGRLPSQRPLACVHVYAGFNRIAPDQDTGMDLNEPWITALELFNAGE